MIESKGKVAQLYIYPIKGLSPHPMDALELTREHGVKGDRACAFLFADRDEQPNNVNTPWRSKKDLAVQNDWPDLAVFQCLYDLSQSQVSIYERGRRLLQVRIDKPHERRQIEEFISNFLITKTPSPAARHPKHSPVRLVGGFDDTTRYPDRSKFHFSLLNLETVRQYERTLGQTIDVRRFRGNLIVDGLTAGFESHLLGKRVKIGSTILSIDAPIGRCHNINVNPESGNADIDLLSALAKSEAKGCFGVLGTVIEGGKIEVGNSMEILSS